MNMRNEQVNQVKKIRVFHTIINEPLIEVATAEGDIDLHNFADLDSYCYEPSGVVTLNWAACETGALTLGGMPVNNVSLRFEGVESFSVTPRDRDMPLSEDKTLDYYQVRDTSPELSRIFFSFSGGISLEIVAQVTWLIAQ